MRVSRLFSQTLREVSADTASHQLLLRAGYIRQLAAGVFTMMPLGQRTMRKIEAIVREEMDRIGGQEMLMPVVHPASIWKETNRWYEVDEMMTRLKDRSGRDMVLAMTHEEVLTDLTRHEIQSYRQLPRLVYHIQTKWRDEPRPRAGLIRTREFTMKDSYSLDADEAGLDKQYRAHYQAYFNIYHQCGLNDVIAVSSDTGMMGGKFAHEFMYLTPIGEDTLLICDETGYAANREVALFFKPAAEPEPPKPVEKVATPETITIEALAQFLNIPKSKTAKAVFMMATLVEGEAEIQRFVFAVVRGDLDLNEVKLANAVRAKALRPATDDEIRAVGAVPGYGSPVGVRDCLIVVDDSIPNSPNLVAGANEAGYHLLNVNYGRDYQADIVADIALAKEGYLTPDGIGTLREVRGVELGHIFKLGTRYSAMMGATFVDQNGEAQPVIMGSYGIGLGRLLACVSQAHHDDYGLRLPITIAPFQVYLMSLPGGETEAEQLYEALQTAGVEVLYDDRTESAGVKFNDGDLIGLPLRVTVSSRSLKQGCIEYKRRDLDIRQMIPLADVVTHVQSEIDVLYAAIQATVHDMPFPTL